MRVEDQGRTEAGKETGRIEAFSDGVFAVAITLLALELRVPRPADLPVGTGLLEVLLEQWPAYVAYVVSFLFILIMWINHHILFTHIARNDHLFLLLNGLLLMLVTLVPFSSGTTTSNAPSTIHLIALRMNRPLPFFFGVTILPPIRPHQAPRWRRRRFSQRKTATGVEKPA